MNIEKIEFPKEIANRLNAKIRQSIKIEYCSGAYVNIDKFNLSILEPHKVILKKGKRVVIVYITENNLVKKSKYNFFINAICEESKHSLNSLINLINTNMC